MSSSALSSKMPAAIAIIAALACFSSGIPARAQTLDSKPRIVDLHVGYDKLYKLGCWTPVRVALQGGLAAGTAPSTAVLQLETSDGDDVPSIYASAPLQLSAGKPTAVTMYVRFGNSMPTMTLTLLVEGRSVLREEVNSQEDLRPGFQPPLPPGERLAICVGRSSAFDEVAGRFGVSDLASAHFNDVAELPGKSYGYDGVDVVLLAADDVQRYASLTPDGAQIGALREWLEFGGKVTIVAGNDARLLFGSPAWQKLASVQVSEAVPLPRTAALEEYAGGNKPVASIPSQDKLRVLRSVGRDEVVELTEGDLPLIVRRAVGFGVLTVSFVDLEHPQLKDWSGRAALLARAMRLGPIGNENTDQGSAQQHRSYGYNDLSGQLRSALDQYEGVAVISFFALAVMILGYIALIGPIDYLIVRKVFRRTEMTWFTFPAIVVATSAAAYFAAIWMKGSELRVSQVDIVDCDVASGSIRGTTFAGVFSPKSDTYDLRVAPPAKLLSGGLVPGRSMTSWLGLSGNGLGGMHGQGGGTSWFTSAYLVSPDLESLTQVPIQVWSSKMFLGRWQGRGAVSLGGALREELDGSLNGTLKSPLMVPLRSALLCYGSKAYQVGELAVGDPCEIAKLNARDLSTVLHQAEVVPAAKTTMNPGVRTRPHDPGSQEVDQILRKMMFYDAAGGRDHANLDHNYHGFLDLSDLLKLKRAVLVGFVDSSPDDGAILELTTDASPAVRRDDRRWVFVRLVVPVEKAP
ncbi:MAG: hypothetical protein K8U03_03750 [Planctomycetia bacterium]|nr:hypothetical protein [Planctomycetia bacterium]